MTEPVDKKIEKNGELTFFISFVIRVFVCFCQVIKKYICFVMCQVVINV